MKIPENTVSEVCNYFVEKLQSHYDKREVKSMMYIAMQHYFGLSRTDLTLMADKRLSESELLQVIHLLKRLKKGVPLAYALGETEFYGLRIKTDPSVLIPRPETEELVDLIIHQNKKKDPHIIDIGTGSGCIALALKKNIPGSKVVAVDFSEEALETARENAGINNMDISFKKDDVLKPIKEYPEFDIIVSNPPYVLEKEKANMDILVKDHEPYSALFVPDEDSLLFYRHIIEFSEKHLKPGGKLYFEINQAKGGEVMKLFNPHLFENIKLVEDLSGNQRMVWARKI